MINSYNGYPGYREGIYFPFSINVNPYSTTLHESGSKPKPLNKNGILDKKYIINRWILFIDIFTVYYVSNKFLIKIWIYKKKFAIKQNQKIGLI